MDKWVGKVAVVTGASSGIGSAIAKELAAQGIIVVGLARRTERVEKLACQVGGKIYAYKCDVSSHESIKEAFKWIEEKFSTISILINNAGVGLQQKVLDTSDEATEAIDRTINTNFTGLIHCTREAARLMKKSNDFGLVVNIGSIVGHVVPFPNPFSMYPATKYAVRAFSEILRQELIVGDNDKIRVSNLSPGVVETEIFNEHGFNNEDKILDKNSYLRPCDISAGVTYLLSTPCSVNVTEITIKPTMEKF